MSLVQKVSRIDKFGLEAPLTNKSFRGSKVLLPAQVSKLVKITDSDGSRAARPFRSLGTLYLCEQAEEHDGQFGICKDLRAYSNFSFRPRANRNPQQRTARRQASATVRYRVKTTVASLPSKLSYTLLTHERSATCA